MASRASPSPDSSASESSSGSPTAVSRAVSSPPDSQPVLCLLLSFRLPQDDAERIARVFASYGIVDVAYLRVLAGLPSREHWLAELRAKGDLSEIQMLVVRDMLNCVMK